MYKRLAELREKRLRDETGFTLIELLVVVVIIGILIAIAIPLYLNYQKGAHDKSAQSDLRNAVNTLEQCNTDNAKYPSAVTAAGAMTGCTGQTLNLSDGTKLTYFPVSSSDFTAYIMESKNDNGNGTVYCYSSAKGGKVTKSTAVAAYPASGACP